MLTNALIALALVNDADTVIELPTTTLAGATLALEAKLGAAVGAGVGGGPLCPGPADGAAVAPGAVVGSAAWTGAALESVAAPSFELYIDFHPRAKARRPTLYVPSAALPGT